MKYLLALLLLALPSLALGQAQFSNVQLSNVQVGVGGGGGGGCSTGPSFVQANSGGAFGDVNAVFSSSVGAGNTVVVGIRLEDETATINSVTMTGCGTFEVHRTETFTSNHKAHVYSGFCSTGGNTTVAVDQSGSDDMGVLIAEYDAVLATSPLDQTTSAQSSSGPPDSGTMATTTCANDLIVAYGTNAGSGSYGAGTNFTARLDVATDTGRHGLEDRVVTATGDYNGVFGDAIANPWTCIAVALKGE